MTARMNPPSQRALKMRDLSPKADFVAAHDRAPNDATRGVEVARKAKKSNNSAASASEIDPNKPLTEKQKQFVKAWAEGDTIPNACLRAGYADDGLGYRLARMPNILALKATYEAKYEEVAQMSRKKVMDMHMEAFEMSKLMSEPSSMVAAAREIGKMCGYYAPVEHRVKVDVSGNVILDRMNSMTDAELLQVINKSAQPLLLEAT